MPAASGSCPGWRGRRRSRRGSFSPCACRPCGYQDKVRDSIRRYKFSGRQGYATRLYGTPGGPVRLTTTWPGGGISSPGCPSPGPRRRERGYDQAFLLASAAALELGGGGGGDAAQGAATPRPSPAWTDDVGPPGQCAGGLRPTVDAELVEGKRVLLHRRRDHHRRDHLRMCKDSAHRGGQTRWYAPPWPGREDRNQGKFCGTLALK